MSTPSQTDVVSSIELSPLTNSEVYDRRRRWAAAVAEQCLDGHHDPDSGKHNVFLILLDEYAVLSRAQQQRLGLARESSGSPRTPAASPAGRTRPTATRMFTGAAACGAGSAMPSKREQVSS